MTKQYFSVLAASVAAAFALLAAPAVSEPIKWDFSDEYGSSEAHTTYRASQFCIGEVEKLAGDELDITYHGGGVLGFKSADHFDAVQDGSVQGAITLLTQLGGIDPLFNLSSLPFLANTHEQAYELWQLARPEYEKVFADNNMVLLWALPNAPSGIHSKMPITTVESLQGLRIRTYDVNGTQTLKEAGAAPLQIAWADLVPQLSTGGVDAVLTSADGGKALSIWEYVSDFSELNYAMAIFVAHVNKDEFDKLPEAARSALMDTIDACDAWNWEMVEGTVSVAYDAMRENGMGVTLDDDIPQEVFDHMRAAGAKVHEAWAAEAGERGARILAEFTK